MTGPTSLASWTRALRKQLDAPGLDSAALCVEAGLDPQQMDDPNPELAEHNETVLKRWTGITPGQFRDGLR